MPPSLASCEGKQSKGSRELGVANSKTKILLQAAEISEEEEWESEEEEMQQKELGL
jgi:hypothetical protein